MTIHTMLLSMVLIRLTSHFWQLVKLFSMYEPHCWHDAHLTGLLLGLPPIIAFYILKQTRTVRYTALARVRSGFSFLHHTVDL